MATFVSTLLSPDTGRWRRLVVYAAFPLAAVIGVLGLAALVGLPLGPSALLLVPATALVLLRSARDAEGTTPGAKADFGLANVVTLLRLHLALLLLVGLWSAPDDRADLWMLFGIAGVALLLDGVDGWLARRRGEASIFGARFDMAADTIFTVVLVIAFIALGLAGVWLVLVALLRPGFVLAGMLSPRMRAPLPPSRRRKCACAMTLLLLVAGLAPPLAEAAGLLGALALAVVAGSFAVDIVHLLLHPERP